MGATYRVFIIVNRPPGDVYEAVADPAQLSAYFTTGGARGRAETGATVQWEFADFPGAFPVRVLEASAPDRIVLEWRTSEPGADYPIEVTIRFSPVTQERTRVEIEERGWPATPQAIHASYGNCMGWSQMLAALKMWMEHGVNLREGAYI